MFIPKEQSWLLVGVSKPTEKISISKVENLDKILGIKIPRAKTESRGKKSREKKSRTKPICQTRNIFEISHSGFLGIFKSKITGNRDPEKSHPEANSA